MKKLHIILLVAVLIFTGCSKRVTSPYIEWQKTYGGNFDDYGTGIIQSTDSGYFIGCTTNSADSNLYSFELLKIDKKGEKEWNKNFELTSNLITVKFTKDGKDTFIAGGWFDNGDKKDIDTRIIKLNDKGKLLWEKNYGGFQSDLFDDYIKTKDQGYLLLLSTNSKGAGGNDYWLIKINKYGTIQWDKTFGTINDENATSLCMAKDSSIYILGNKFGSNKNEVLWLIKTDKYGNKIWAKTLGSKKQEEACSVLPTKDDGIIVSANIFYDGDSSDVCLLKLDNKGNIKWNYIWKNGLKNQVKGYSICDDGSVVFTGNSYGKKSEIFIFKISKNGKLIWYKIINNIQDITAKDIIQTSDKGFAIIGSSYSPEKKTDCLVIKLSSDKLK